FPFPPTAHGAINRVFSRVPSRPLPSRWSAAHERAVENYLLTVPRALRALFPNIRFAVSATASRIDYLRQLDTSELDYLDVGLWLDDDPRFRVDLLLSGVMRRRLAMP